MKNPILHVETRELLGRKVAGLRRNGIVPAVMYGRGFDTFHLQVPLKAFESVYAEAGESTVVQIELGDQKYPVIIQEVVREPIKDQILHVDFYRVRLDEAISANVPLEFIGEAPAVQDFQGVLIKNISEIEVEGLPQDLPHNIEVDLSSLTEIGSQLNVGDLKVSSKLKVKTDAMTPVALIQEQAKEEVIETAPTVEDVEVIGKEKVEGEEGEEESAEPQAEETKE